MEYTNKLKREALNLKFSSMNYKIQQNVYVEYKTLRKYFIYYIKIFKKYNIKYKSAPPHNLYLSYYILKKVTNFYIRLDKFITFILDEIFRYNKFEDISKKYKLLEILNKILKLFFIFDVERLRNDTIFSDFTKFKIENYKSKNKKITFFCALAMPMANLFISYFVTDVKDVHIPIIISKRSSLYLSDNKKACLYYLCYVFYQNKNLNYCFVFFAGLYNKFFSEEDFDSKMFRYNRQKVAYYHGITNII